MCEQEKPETVATFDGEALARDLEAAIGERLTEAGFARAVLVWEEAPAAHASALALAERYAAWATLTPAGRARSPPSPPRPVAALPPYPQWPE